jgi:hypothetical protein
VTRVRPSARTVPLLRATVLALKASGKDIKKQINDETRGTLNGPWREAIATHAGGSRMDNLVFGKGARIAAGNPARLVSTSSRRPLRKGLNGFVPDSMGRLLEFPVGTAGKTSTYERTFKGGKRHKVTRRTMTGLPSRRPGGRVVYPAVAEVMPRFVSMWVQIVVRNIHESLDGKK